MVMLLFLWSGSLSLNSRNWSYGHVLSKNIRDQNLILVLGRGGVLGKTWEMHRVILVPSKPSLTLLCETRVLSPCFVLLRIGDVPLLWGLTPTAPKPPCPCSSLSGGYRTQNINKWTEPADHEPDLEKTQQIYVKKKKKVFLQDFGVFRFLGSPWVLISYNYPFLVPLHNQDRGARTCPTRIGTLKTNKGWAFLT